MWLAFLLPVARTKCVQIAGNNCNLNIANHICIFILCISSSFGAKFTTLPASKRSDGTLRTRSEPYWLMLDQKLRCNPRCGPHNLSTKVIWIEITIIFIRAERRSRWGSISLKRTLKRLPNGNWPLRELASLSDQQETQKSFQWHIFTDFFQPFIRIKTEISPQPGRVKRFPDSLCFYKTFLTKTLLDLRPKKEWNMR